MSAGQNVASEAHSRKSPGLAIPMPRIRIQSARNFRWTTPVMQEWISEIIPVSHPPGIKTGILPWFAATQTAFIAKPRANKAVGPNNKEAYGIFMLGPGF